ncbi:DUF1573 domain-containing protein [Flavobacterium hibernum]|jgi:hypothetical protein|uniref:DUF1573 domain-containing protein n=1 Tax=Flavobacterium hibernum TaxID=37752 RepID=A0A0D0EF08_9FLAO|nr:DUF1573 domain-containing protein [Flavobacterium hibernum]KIO53279.1 hypothetical protein IW18_08180 [Flavobacterium hibernum]OXA87879.1 hypothetical protein B0A73_08795 [Flavobacterium hibernum]STO10467.1 Protein of uncharacterised function (DUF1573) [Flavobacterium hibernum]
MKMIKISMLALALGLMSFSAIAPIKSISSENKIVADAASTIVWKAETIDVGQIPQGTPKAIVYEFKNTGKTAVVITSVQGSCGCTATDYTKEPILPGKSAKVTATYNAANKGGFTKTVTVTTSAETTPKVLTLKGTVI